jgi:hypothetical protein
MLTALKNDLYDVVQYIQDPVKLREELSVCYEGHVKESIQAVEIDPDISKEYKRQRTYLENSVEVLKKKLSRDVRGRKNDNMRVMQENVALIKEINQMRRELKLMHQVQRQRELNTSEAERSLQPVDASWNEKEAKRILSIQKEQISYLRKEVEEWQARLVNKRPISRERLSGMDDYSTAQQLH